MVVETAGHIGGPDARLVQHGRVDVVDAVLDGLVAELVSATALRGVFGAAARNPVVSVTGAAACWHPVDALSSA